MREVKFIAFILIIMFASPLFGYNKEDKWPFPIRPGDSQETVHKKFGNPTKSGASSGAYREWFDDIGLFVEYDDNKNVNVIKLQIKTITKLHGYRIFGFRIGDYIQTCAPLWGEPDKIEKTEDNLSKQSWTVKGLIIEIEYYDVNVGEVSSITGIRWSRGVKGQPTYIWIKKGTEK
jgi:hypothetical protein